MLQSRAIKLISDYVLASKLVSGLYLSGSLVKKPEDASGDIHLHLVVEEGKYEAVYQQREKILTAYYSILHLDEEESTKVFRCVYDNGVILYLYIVLEKDIKVLCGVKIIFDHTNLLTKKALMENSNEEIARTMNDFSFILVNYYNYLRSDESLYVLKEASKLAIVLKKLLSLLERITKNNEEIEKLQYFESNEKKFFQAVKYVDINQSLTAVKLMMGIFDQIINEMTIELAQIVDIDLYLFAKERIWKL